jgi:hypothetical protein
VLRLLLLSLLLLMGDLSTDSRSRDLTERRNFWSLCKSRRRSSRGSRSRREMIREESLEIFSSSHHHFDDGLSHHREVCCMMLCLTSFKELLSRP